MSAVLAVASAGPEVKEGASLPIVTLVVTCFETGVCADVLKLFIKTNENAITVIAKETFIVVLTGLFDSRAFMFNIQYFN